MEFAGLDLGTYAVDADRRVHFRGATTVLAALTDGSMAGRGVGDGRAEAVAAILKGERRALAVAESLTGGLLTSRLAATRGASDWLRGGVVAYHPQVKFELLGVRRGPVVNAETASSMASGVARVLQADVSIALTGVGGPDDEEGQPAGTVWVGLYRNGDIRTVLLRLEEDTPAEICRAACDHGLQVLAEFLGSEQR